MTADELKQAAAEAALADIRPGMKLGLGTGSTVRHFVAMLGAWAKNNAASLLCVPTSEETRKQAEQLGLVVTTLDAEPILDLTVDGADEVDPSLNLIKGAGGALLREKIVATSSRRMIVIADQTKYVERLGAFPLSVEVVPFGLKATALKIDRCFHHLGLQGAITVRVREGRPFVTDNGNLVLDCALGQIKDAAQLGAHLSGIPGLVDHGLFIGVADEAIIAGPKGVKRLKR